MTKLPGASRMQPDAGMTRGEFRVMPRSFYVHMGRSRFNGGMSGIAVLFRTCRWTTRWWGRCRGRTRNSILNGTGEHTMSPEMQITRAQTAAILERYDRQFGTGTPAAKAEEESKQAEAEEPTKPTEAETPTPSITASTEEQIEEELIRLINDYRAENGLTRLKKNEKLMETADIRAKEITTNFSHIRPNGRS